MLLNMFKRMKDVYVTNPQLIQKSAPYLVSMISETSTPLADYLFVDDDTMMHAFKVFSVQQEDPILADLASRLLNRDIFKYDEIENTERIESLIEAQGYDKAYYLASDSLQQKPYLPYVKHGQQINILSKDQEVRELSEVSMIVHAITTSQTQKDMKVFFPNLEVNKQ